MHLPLALPPAAGRIVDVVALGECSVDLLGVVAPTDSAGGKVALTNFQILPGGQAATVAVGCARLGWRSRYIGCLGEDHWAPIVRDRLTTETVHADVQLRPGVPSRIAIILVDPASGDRRVFEHRDARLALTVDEAMKRDATAGRLLMVDTTDPDAAVAAASAARANGIPTLVDADRPGASADRVLPHIDVIVVSESFAGGVGAGGGIGAGLAALDVAFRPALVVATLGAEGSLARCQGREVRTPAFRVEVQDTTGAGDAFRAGLLAGWLVLGDHPNLDTLLQYANACGALNCREVGAQTALATAAEVASYVTVPGRGQSN